MFPCGCCLEDDASCWAPRAEDFAIIISPRDVDQLGGACCCFHGADYLPGLGGQFCGRCAVRRDWFRCFLAGVEAQERVGFFFVREAVCGFPRW